MVMIVLHTTAAAATAAIVAAIVKNDSTLPQYYSHLCGRYDFICQFRLNLFDQQNKKNIRCVN